MFVKKRHLQILWMLVILAFASISRARSEYDSPLQKLDPVLKAIVVKGETRGFAPAQNAAFAPARRGGSDMVSAIIKVSGSPMSIESTGARVRSVVGDIVTADIPLDSLNDLMNLPNVTYIQAARQMQPTLLEASVPDTRADQVWASVPGYTGKGVIVGVIDGGIDWRHPDFADSDGTSRILYIWDQSVQTPERFPMHGYGTEWTKADIDSAQCQEMDATSHGTHTASTIAGNGRDRHEFTGVAPEAYIIAVKSSFRDADIIDAADYIFSKAEELNMPAVINMSFGSQWGAHDGTTLLDQALDRLLERPGRVITASAGNDGGSGVHVGTSSLRRFTLNDYPWTAVLPDVGTQSLAVQIWYPAEEFLSVRFVLPDDDSGNLGNVSTEWMSTGEFGVFTVTDGPLIGAEIVMDNDLLASESQHPDFNGIYIRISDGDNLTIPIDEFIYGIEFAGPGVEMDAYVLGHGRFVVSFSETTSSLNSAFLLKGDGNRTVLSPSSASSVISVGAYVTRSEWVDAQNRIRSQDFLNIGAISAFSSRGPLLNGVQKPEIAAPGESVVAAFSSDAWGRPQSIYLGGEHRSWRGTSMSSPHVAGAAALLFQREPNLTAREVKNILTNTAVDRGPTGWDKSWGHGKLDVLAAMGIPSAPRGLRATAADGSVNVSWLLNQENDIAGYKISVEYEIQDSGFQLRTFNIAHPTSSYEITDLPNGVLMILSISARDAGGDESASSQEITITPNPPAEDVTPPNPPENLSIVAISAAADLTWSPALEHDLSGYRVYYGTSTGNLTRQVWASKNTKRRLTDLANDQRVYVAVTSIDTSGNESEKSSEVSATPRLLSRIEHRYQGGWPVSMQHDIYASPALYDIDGDGLLEVAISSRDGKIYLLRHNGRNVAGWPVSTGSVSVSSPAIGDVDGDGRAEIVAAAGNMIYMWRDNGSLMPGWPVNIGSSVLASPALGDIDGDNIMEVVIGSWDGNLYAFNDDGSRVAGWPVTLNEPVYSSAALGDIDGDGEIEVVIGSGDGDVYVFKGDGTIADGWPVHVGEEIRSSPALGDIDGDGEMEIVIADEFGGVHAWHHNGELVSGWPVDLRDRISSSPVLGDIDGDGKALEIAISTRFGSVYVLKSDGTTMDGWPVSVINTVTASPALGDINGDGNVDVVVATGTGLGYVGLIYAFGNTGKSISSTRWPIFVEGNIEYSSPALADLDGDGDVELIVGSSRQGDGTGGRVHAWDLTGRLKTGSIVWGGFRHDSLHTGVAEDRLSPSFVIAVLQNAALKNHSNIYAIASERLITAPDLTVEAVLSEPNEDNRIQFIPLTQLDADPRIYMADVTIESNGSYTFTISGTDVNGNTGHSSKTVSIQIANPDLPAPARFSLLPNYPNPFNPGTWIPYELLQSADVAIDIYSISGNLIRSLKLGRRAAGNYTSSDAAAYWDGTDNYAQEVASGVYFYVLRADDFRALRKMILSK